MHTRTENTTTHPTTDTHEDDLVVLRQRLAERFAPGTYLSYDAVFTSPISFDFSAPYDYDGDGSSGSWRVADHPSVEDQIEELIQDLEVVYVPSSVEGRPSLVEVSVPDSADGDVILTLVTDIRDAQLDDAACEAYMRQFVKDLEAFGLNSELGIVEEFGDDPRDMELYVSRGQPGWEKLIRLHGLDPETFGALLDDREEDEDDWMPVMNYLYPLPHGGVRTTKAWHRVMCCTTVVEVGGETYLALTGGGMDLSWEICVAYLQCGYLPPAHFARMLPAMASRGASERDQDIVAACSLSLLAEIDSARQGLESLQRIVQQALARGQR